MEDKLFAVFILAFAILAGSLGYYAGRVKSLERALDLEEEAHCEARDDLEQIKAELADFHRWQRNLVAQCLEPEPDAAPSPQPRVPEAVSRPC